MEILKISVCKYCKYLIIIYFICDGYVTMSQNTPETYITRYRPIADSLQVVYSVPASIILATACLESGFGTSSAARERNNHFGINNGLTRYATGEASFVSYCELISGSARYASLFNLCVYNYKGWAYGLQRFGYAVDNRYGWKLVVIIEKFIIK